MRRAVMWGGAAAAAVVLLLVLLAATGTTAPGMSANTDMGGDHAVPDDASSTSDADVVMPVKSSRPGCEADDLCYIPATTTVVVGRPVSWINDDSAFHSVTGGEYGMPDGLFDSGYMDPGDVFWHSFENPGTYAYHCTLHEWMRGTVVVVAGADDDDDDGKSG